MATALTEMNSGVHRRTGKATITFSGATSGSISSVDWCMFGAQVDSAFDGVAMGFQVSADDTTFQDLYDYTGTIVSMTMAASTSYDLPGALAAWPYWKFKPATTQTGTTTIVVVGKG